MPIRPVCSRIKKVQKEEHVMWRRKVILVAENKVITRNLTKSIGWDGWEWDVRIRFLFLFLWFSTIFSMKFFNNFPSCKMLFFFFFFLYEDVKCSIIVYTSIMFLTLLTIWFCEPYTKSINWDILFSFIKIKLFMRVKKLWEHKWKVFNFFKLRLSYLIWL